MTCIGIDTETLKLSQIFILYQLDYLEFEYINSQVE